MANESSDILVFMMQKDDAMFYYNMSGPDFVEPKAILPYLNSKVLIADLRTIVVLDTLSFPPNRDSNYTTLFRGNITEPFGLAFATMSRGLVTMSSAIYLTTTIIAIVSSVMNLIY